MAAGRRREERERTTELAMWVWALTGDIVTEWGVGQYWVRGTMPSDEDRKIPANPDVERKVAEIHRLGKVVF